MASDSELHQHLQAKVVFSVGISLAVAYSAGNRLAESYSAGNRLAETYSAGNRLAETYSAMAEGAISSRFSMLHSSKNSRIGDGCDPTEM